jgi:hypothetical protein
MVKENPLYLIRYIGLSSRIYVAGKEFFIGAFKSQVEAQLSFLDAYYLFRGFLHKGDKREI